MSATARTPTEILKNAVLPVFFLQMGNNTSLFFDKVLEQAVLTNGAGNVFVLIDTNFDLYKAYNCIDISTYAATARPFDQLYQHHSTNSYFFEKTCFDRWFIINDLIADLGIANFIYADCDVLLLKDLKPFFDDKIQGCYDGTMMFLQTGDNSITSAHTSFWNHNLLSGFCDFINNLYADKERFAHLLADTLAGKFYNNKNVSDMILLDVFRTQTQPATLNLLTLDAAGVGFDFNLNAAYNGGKYTYNINPVTGIKKLVKRKNGGMYAISKDSGQKSGLVDFYTLHFQGYLTKALIPMYVQSPNYRQRVTNMITARMEFATRRLKVFKNRIKALVKK